MNYGYKKGFIGAFGCFTIEVIYMLIGITAIKQVGSVVPETLTIFLKIFAGLFLFYLAYGFWTADVKKMRQEKVIANSLSIYLKLVILTLTSPIAIIGYASIFSSIENISGNVFSILSGSCSASICAHSVVVVCFATLGKKINNTALIILNKCSAMIIMTFAIKLIYSVAKLYL